MYIVVSVVRKVSSFWHLGYEKIVFAEAVVCLEVSEGLS